MTSGFRTYVRSISCIAILSICAAGLPAYGQTKLPTAGGCTTEQMRLPGAKECVRLLEQDVLKNNKKVHQVICSISGIRCCVIDNERITDCGPVFDTSKKVEDDKKAAEAKKKQEEESKKKEDAKRKDEEAKKAAAQKGAANPNAGLKLECVADKDGSDYAIKVFTTNNSDFDRTCTVECSYARSDKKSGTTKCSDIRISAHSPRQRMCTDAGAKLGPGPYTNVSAKQTCR